MSQYSKRGNRIAVALADPTNLRALDEIRFQTGLAVDPVVVEASKLVPLVQRLSETAETKLNELAGDDLDLELADETEDATSAETPARSRSMTRPLSVSSRKSCSMPSMKAPRTSISSPTRSITASVSAPMAFCAKSPSPPRHQGKNRLPHQGDFPAGHIRETGPAGRPHEAGALENPRHRFPRQHPAHAAWRKNRHAHSGPLAAPCSASMPWVTSRSSAKR
jgi:hypothetical protein